MPGPFFLCCCAAAGLVYTVYNGVMHVHGVYKCDELFFTVPTYDRPAARGKGVCMYGFALGRGSSVIPGSLILALIFFLLFLLLAYCRLLLA